MDLDKIYASLLELHGDLHGTGQWLASHHVLAAATHLAYELRDESKLAQVGQLITDQISAMENDQSGGDASGPNAGARALSYTLGGTVRGMLFGLQRQRRG